MTRLRVTVPQGGWSVRKDRSLSQYAVFATYKARTWLIVPYVI